MSRGRRPGFKMTDEHRAKIANSQILKRLIDHVEGKADLSSTQVTAAIALLRKVMPDMTESKNEVVVEERSVMRMPPPAKDTKEWSASYGSLNPAPKQH